MGGAILYTDSTHIKANQHKKKLASVEQTPKAYMEELDAQVDQDRKVPGKKPFDREDKDHRGGGTTSRMQSTTVPERGQQSREEKPDGFHKTCKACPRRTVSGLSRSPEQTGERLFSLFTPYGSVFPPRRAGAWRAERPRGWWTARRRRWPGGWLPPRPAPRPAPPPARR